MIYKYTIPLPPVTKKNSQRILVNRKTGMPFIAPSSAYKRYEQQAITFLAPKPKTPLAGRYHVAAVFYMPTRRRVDLTNLLEAAHDTLVAAKSLQTITTPSLPAWTAPVCSTTKKIQERKLLYRS